MNHKRVRTDTFSSVGNQLRVTGRQGYEASTDIWVSRVIETEFEQKIADTEDLGWNVLRGGAYSIPHDYTQPNLNGKVDLTLTPYGINNSLENVQIKPVGCKTAYDAYPKTQVKLLPYLIPFRQFVRQNPFEKRSFETRFDVNSESSHVGGSVPEQHWWDTSVNGDLVFSTHANATVTGDNNSLPNVGFCPRHMIQFGTFATAPQGNPQNVFQTFSAPGTQYLVPIGYNEELDRLSFNNYANINIIVRVQTEVLGGAPNAGNAHFFELDPTAVAAVEYDNDRWSMRFDENGIAGRITQHTLVELPAPAFVQDPGPSPPAPGENNHVPLTWSTWLNNYDLYQKYLIDQAEYEATLLEIDDKELWYGLKNNANWPVDNKKYKYSQNELNEFYELHLFSVGQQNKLVVGSVAVPQTFGAGGNSYPNFRLFLRRPRFSKGNAYNWSANPAQARFFSWYNKEISLANPVAGIFDHFDEPTPFVDLARRNVPKIREKLGDWRVTWGGINSNNAGQSTERIIAQVIINIDDVGLWAVIGAKAPQEETCLLLETGPVIEKQGNNTFYPLVQGQVPNIQHLPMRYVTFADGTNKTKFYLRFQTRQAQFAQGAGLNTITIGYTYLAGQGGANNWGFGIPQTLGSYDVYPTALGTTGWVEEDAPGQSLKATLTAEGDPAQGMFTNVVTEIPNSWGTGRRPLFSPAPQWGNLFGRHTKIDPTHSNTNVDDTELWFGLNNMFKGAVYTEVPELIDYRTVRVGRSSNSVTLKEPFFGLDSGMSTFRVSHIFKPRSWYNILLQDFDYSFQRAKTCFLERNTRVSYTLEAERDVGTANGVVQEEVEVTLPVNLKLNNATKTSITVRSRDGLDQRTKLLENISEPYPLFKKYITEVEGGAESATIHIYTERGVPDWLFIFAERDFADDTQYIPEGHPMIVGLEVYGRTNKNKALSSYLNDKHEIWQATLRNAHPLSDDNVLTEIGGVLLSKEDLGTLERDKYSTLDCFDYDLKIYLENEAQGSIETNAQEAARNALPITLHVCCIYQDQLYLKGSSTNLSFVESKTY